MTRLLALAKPAIIAGLIVLTLSLLVVLYFALVRPRVGQVDAVIVLGAKVDTPAMIARAQRGAQLVARGTADTLVLSGGQGSNEPESEAQAMARVARTELGDRPATLVLEDTSRNTYENIRNARRLLPEARSVVVVSDVFHLARAVALARRAGFSTVYWDAPRPSYYPIWELAYLTVREAIGLVVYIPRLIFGSGL